MVGYRQDAARLLIATDTVYESEQNIEDASRRLTVKSGHAGIGAHC